MNNCNVRIKNIGAVIFSFLLIGCGVPAVSTHPAIAQSPAIASIIPSNTPGAPKPTLLLPVGRTAIVGGNKFQVFVDSKQYTPTPTYDDYGGYWIEAPYDPKKNYKVALRFAITNTNKGLYREEGEHTEKWLTPSQLIDSDNPGLVEKANQLTGNFNTYEEKARSIHEFIIGYLTFQPYGRHYLSSASETYRLEYGTCVNYARLFVALSRAANVPARTVWGATFNNGEYEHHHEWAEYMDDDGYWHPLDLSYTTSFELSDVNYLDLIYSSEENPLYERSTSEQYSKNMPQYIVFDTTASPYDGRLGFTFVENNFPISYVVENVFVLSEIPHMVPQKVP
jgi:hypothetical protein